MKSSSPILSFVVALVTTASGCKPPVTPVTEPDPSEFAPRAAQGSAAAAGPSITQFLRPLPPVGDVNAQRVLLGRQLFHDTRLSRDNTLSCASCHSLDRGGVDGQVVSTGIRGQRGGINSPTVLNARFNFVQFWDGRAADLTAQAAGPVANPIEMGNDWDNVVATLRTDRTYVDDFARSYPDGLTARNVQDAIAAYEMTLVTPSRVDRFLAGDTNALNAEEREGAALFASVGCTTCHNGINVGGGMYQRMGLVNDYFAARGTPLTEADNGRYNVTHQDADRHQFKVPTLRNVARTAPYFHDGSATTLEQAVRTMAHVQIGRDLDGAQVSRIVTFLRALDGEIPAEARLPARPAAVPVVRATAGGV